MRKPLIICVFVAIAAVLFTSLATAATTRTVKVGNNWFYKSTPRVPKITVKQNTTIRFSVVKGAHDVAGYRGTTKKWQSPEVYVEGDVWRKKMRQRGTFTIVCTIHGRYDQSMKIVVVRP
jgi:plastocyanin